MISGTGVSFRLCLLILMVSSCSLILLRFSERMIIHSNEVKYKSNQNLSGSWIRVIPQIVIH